MDGAKRLYFIFMDFDSDEALLIIKNSDYSWERDVVGVKAWLDELRGNQWETSPILLDAMSKWSFSAARRGFSSFWIKRNVFGGRSRSPIMHLVIGKQQWWLAIKLIKERRGVKVCLFCPICVLMPCLYLTLGMFLWSMARGVRWPGWPNGGW